MAADLFTAIAERISDLNAPFLEAIDGKGMTYGELLAQSAKLARALRVAGVREDDRVLVQVEKSPEALSLYLACLRAGAIFVPLNTAYTTNELEYFIADADPALVVCNPAVHETVQHLCLGRACLTLDERGEGSLMQIADKQPLTVIDAQCRSEDLAAILYTSGTTGRAKGAMLSHGNLLSNARSLVQAWRFTA
jgi:malonyl-CoA/methylmalonyl-CoA synthetase